jgi:hypothetical protein
LAVPNPESLTIRVTVIADQRYADDYAVIWRGMSIGRIKRGAGAPHDRPRWSWSCHLSGRPQAGDERKLSQRSRDYAMRLHHVVLFDTAASSANIRTMAPTGRMYPGGCAGLGAAVPGPCILAATPFRA